MSGSLPHNLHALLEKGVLAPSGDNMQPWKFAINGDSVDLFLDESRFVPFWDDGLRAPQMAAGAVIENLRIASLHEGYQLEVQYLPNPSNLNWTCRLKWHAQNPNPQELYPYLSSRCTNRKFYHAGHLSDADWQSLHENEGPLKIAWVKKGTPEFFKFSRLFGQIDQLRFENEVIHRGLIDGLRFGAKVQSSRDGLDVKTLEVGPDFMLKAIASWGRCKILNHLGFSWMLGQITTLQMKSSLGIGFIISSEKSPITFIKTGEMLQRVWLKLTKLNLALQPMSTLPLFITHVDYSRGRLLSSQQQQKTYEAKAETYSWLKIAPGSELVFAFRFGFAGEPSARALRRDLQSFLISKQPGSV